jgi:hypothetical protein
MSHISSIRGSAARIARRPGIPRHRVAARVAVGCVVVAAALRIGELVRPLPVPFPIAFRLMKLTKDCVQFLLRIRLLQLNNADGLLDFRIIGIESDDHRRFLVAVPVVVHIDIGQTLGGEAGGLAVGVVLDLQAEDGRGYPPIFAGPFPIGLEHEPLEKMLVGAGQRLELIARDIELLGGTFPRCALSAMLGGAFEEVFLLGRGWDGVRAAWGRNGASVGFVRG